MTGAIDCRLPCALCGGDLFGIHLDAPCPHCGADVGRTIKIAAIDPATMTVACDALCAGCDYNLRTMPVASFCPECSRPVVESLAAVDLQFADPAWVARVRRGLTTSPILRHRGRPPSVYSLPNLNRGVRDTWFRIG